MRLQPYFKEINPSSNSIRYSQSMADIAPKLIHLSGEELLALHNNVHKSESPTSAEVEVHHTILNEMARRKMERPRDDWDKIEILVDSIDNVDLTSLSGLPPETLLDVIKETGDTAGDIKTFFTVNGYQMRVESVEKRIAREGDKYTVYNEAGTRSFGTYDSREEAEERLRQIEFFKEQETYKPPKGVRDAAQRALEWIEAGLAGGGFTSVGRTRAGQLARGESVSIDTLKRMKSFLSRHKVDGQALGFNRGEKGFPSAGRVSWDAWGGDAGFAWAESMVERYENSLKKNNIEEIIEVAEQEIEKNSNDALADEITKSLGKFDVQKAEHEKRYTLGAMYIPDMEDAHGEWTDSDELQRAVWDYVRSNDRRIRLQHERNVVAGEWVEVMTFPYSLTVPVKTVEGKEMEHTYPPNTVFLGVIWEPWAWEMVTEGKIRGYSIGGKAERLFVDMEVDKNDPTVSDVHVDTIMNPAKKKPKKEETV